MQALEAQPEAITWPPARTTSVGWGAVEDAVRKDDEALVNDCKDDINTLLTFAGLYSAALTALLALAFGMLQEDVASESLQVLRQISTQTMTYQILPGGLLNATIVPPPSPPPSPFTPSDQAIRVNVLWFASLVLSLTTASIGILVKQWLRAYTTYTTSSAQSRMRTRRFRRRGLELWKVFEIAAALPYLIQLALGLFFVGLCYFTAEVDPRLGRTTLPLVAAWAFFFLMTSLLPVFSSQCPYKGVSFERRLSSFRRQLFSALATAASMPLQVKKWAEARTVDSESSYSEPYNPIDEAHAAKYTGNDTHVMTWVDGLQSDDELFGHAIATALKQSQPNHKHIVNFVLRAITDRTQTEQVSVEDEPKVLDCSSLTLQAFTGVIDILATQTSITHVGQYLHENWIEDIEQWGKYISWTICILYSVSKHALPPSGLRLLGRCHMTSEKVNTYITRHVCKHIEAGDALKLSLIAVQHVCREDNDDLEQIIFHIKNILKDYFDLAKLPGPDQVAAVSPSNTQTHNQPSEWAKFLNESSLGDTVVFLAEVLVQWLHGMPSRSSASQQQGLLDSAHGLIFRLSATIHSATGFSFNVVTALAKLSMDHAAKQDAEFIKSMLQAMIAQPHISVFWCGGAILSYGCVLNTNELEAFQIAIQAIAQTTNNMCLESAINLSYIAVYVLRWGNSDIKDTNLSRRWRNTFEDVGQLLQGAMSRGRTTVMSENSIAETRFRPQILWMNYLDTGIHSDQEDDAAYITWSETFDQEQSVFDDRFVLLVAKLYPVGGQKQWRIRRLEDMQKRDGEFEKGKDTGGESKAADAGDEDDRKGEISRQPVADEHGKMTSDSGQVAGLLRSNEGGDLVAGREAKHETTATAVPTSVGQDDGNDIEESSRPAAGDSRSALGTTRDQSMTHSSLNGGGADCNPVVSMKDAEGDVGNGAGGDAMSVADDRRAAEVIQDESTVPSNLSRQSVSKSQCERAASLDGLAADEDATSLDS